jgi:hypothetical protein
MITKWKTVIKGGGRIPFQEMGMELRVWTQLLYHLSHTSSPVCSGYFGDGGISQTICPGWPRTAILQILVSQITRIIGVSHQHPAWNIFWRQKSLRNNLNARRGLVNKLYIHSAIKKYIGGLGVVLSTCNSSYSGGRDRRIEIWGKMGQELVRLHVKSKLKLKRLGEWLKW